MGRTLSRVAGVVFAGALATFAATPAALAQTETSASPTETDASTSESPASSSSTTTTTSSSTSVTPPSSTAPSASPRPSGDVKTTEKRIAPQVEPDQPAQEAPKDDYQDNTGHGFVGLGGEGVLVIACAAGRPGEVATQYLSVTGGPDQDEANGLWNYTVRVVDAPAGTTTAKFSWTCGGIEGNGTVEFEQEQLPPTSTVTATVTATATSTGTSTSTPSSSAPAPSTAPLTTASSTTATGSTPAGNAAPKAQVKVAPKGGVETGFGGTAW